MMHPTDKTDRGELHGVCLLLEAIRHSNYQYTYGRGPPLLADQRVVRATLRYTLN